MTQYTVDSGDKFLEYLERVSSTDMSWVMMQYHPMIRHYMSIVGYDDELGLKEAYKSYGPSWKQRGGIGAFMMLARKWDRLVNRVKNCGGDLVDAISTDTRREGVIDDVRDLRRYLILVEAELLARGMPEGTRFVIDYLVPYLGNGPGLMQHFKDAWIPFELIVAEHKYDVFEAVSSVGTAKNKLWIMRSSLMVVEAFIRSR